ncbi:MAG: OmpA family protein [Bacteroidetes bacterium]|nr:OmpA family protein [Bacteroidota bacterium]
MNKFIPMDFSKVSASDFWSIPSWGTSDLFCHCNRQTKERSDNIYSEVDVPQNTMGYQYPHSGTCYAGFFAFSHGNYREYLQTPLKEPLKKNHTYLFTMYLSLADYSQASVNQLGVCFMPSKANYASSDCITDMHPVYISIERLVGNDIHHWHQVTATYTAKGGEQYLLFGSFVINRIKKTKLKAPKNIKTRINQTSERDAYYFIDDVSLVETILPLQPDTIEHPLPESPVKVVQDTLLTFKCISFKSNESLLLQASFTELDHIVQYLKKKPSALIEIYGHTDNSGKEPFNKTLSINRAKAVANYLIQQGISKSRIIYQGYGSSKPITTNETEEGKLQNRRVEFIIR